MNLWCVLNFLDFISWTIPQYRLCPFVGFASLSIGLTSQSSKICFVISQIAWPVRRCVCVCVVMAVPSGKQGIGANPKEGRDEAGAVAGRRLCVWASYRVSHQGRWHSGHSGYVPVAKSIWKAVLLQCRNYCRSP